MSLTSKLTSTIKTDSSRSSSLRMPAQESSTKHETADRPEICVSPTWNQHQSMQKKEKRVTKRLEAERQELEKRLRKLEEAEQTRDLTSIQHETRRLTKKQPMGSSSRDSSADSRRSSSSRMSAFIAGVKRVSRSRSRASSVDGDDQGVSKLQSTESPKQRQENKSQPQPAAPHLSAALPERLGVSISRELAQRNSPLLPNSLPANQPQRSLHAMTKSADLREISRNSQVMETYPEDNIETAVNNHPNVDNERAAIEPYDLDRASFAATLGFRNNKRGHETAQSHGSSQNTITQKERDKSSAIRAGRQDLDIPGDTSHSTNPKTPSSLLSRQEGSSRNSSIRSSVDANSISQRKFKSSPLAAAPTTSDNVAIPLSIRGTDIASSSKSPGAEQASVSSQYSQGENRGSKRFSGLSLDIPGIVHGQA